MRKPTPPARSSFLTDLDRAGPFWAAALGIASHAAALGGGFVWLDHAHLEGGLALAPPGAFLSLFERGFAGTGFYRPLMALSLSLDRLVSAGPGFAHWVTLAFHATAAALLVVTGRALAASPRAALFAGLIFAAHPLTSLVASAIAFRSEAMALVFLLALIVFHVRRRPVLAALSLAAGALSKETAWLLSPLFIIALEVSAGQGTRPAPSANKARRGLLLAEGIAFLTVCALHWLYAPAHRAEFPALTFDQNLGTRLAAVGKGFLHILWPFSDTLCDAFPASSSLSSLSLLGLACLFLLAITRFVASTARWLLLLALLPSLQLVPIMRWWSPHYFYIPLAFLALVVAGELDQRVRRPWPAVALSLVPLVALSSAASVRYRNDTALWAPEVRQQPACREGHFYLGEVARRASDLQSAVRHYARAVQPVPGVLAYVDELAAYENLGAVSLALGRLAEARTALEAALERAGEPERRRRVLYNLALVAFRAKDPLETARLLAPEAEAVEPLAPALLLRARALHQLGREQEAARMLRLLPVKSSTGEPLATLR